MKSVRQLVSILLITFVSISVFSSCNKSVNNEGQATPGSSRWINTYEFPEGIEDIYALNETHVWASGQSGGIYFFDGLSWSKQYDANRALSEITAVDERHVWIESFYEIYFFDGVNWTMQYSLIDQSQPRYMYNPDSTPGIHHISAADETHVWATGDEGIYFFDGINWSLKNELGGGGGVVAVDPQHVWVGAEDGTYFFDGNSWTKQNDVSLTYFSAVDANNIWAVDRGEDYIYFFDGSTWTRKSKNLISLMDISAKDKDNLWVVGFPPYTDVPKFDGCIYLYDGRDWVLQEMAKDTMFECVTSVDGRHAWAVAGGGGIISLYEYSEE
jgi:hypothetical protein